MSEYKKILQLLENQNKKLERMNKLLVTISKNKEPKRKIFEKRIKDKIIIKGPTDIIKKIYLESFFVNSKTSSDVQAKMKIMKYNYRINAIHNALERAPFLIKKGKKGNYTYIQKYPPK